ncbi:uncharacterized protein BO72DRAFT_495884 [Aspergillus fijiensis CBS 313.89]|uniref:Uncharacterized protein n=1 Tax=Aspergillus fijiensis CBS 313.89 TaxID=1448319 RepID=A0A8G1VYT4_9EURO|nr:uncharacterized protein BO72DRAFT_495884 [Aspergillus fijiensis CBS 313.89]RAK77582.1 hypothetical protein BO72DRAFT_495884 [Aspergillus fijiensis CBS 313.89]
MAQSVDHADGGTVQDPQLRFVETSSSTGVSRVIGSTRPNASGTAAVLKAALTAALEAPEALAVLNTSVALKAVLTAVPAALTVVLTAALVVLEALVVPAALTVTVALKAVPADAGKYDLTYLRPPFHRASPGVEACLDCTYVVGFDCG